MHKLINRLEQLERDIESSIQSVGKALTEIHDTKAYKAEYDTFEAYCKTRWGFTDRYARDLIDAESVRVKIGTLVPVLEMKTKHLVAISKIPANKQAQVTASVFAECEAENRKPTEKDFKEAAKPFANPKQEHKKPAVEVEYTDFDDEPKEEPKAKPETTPKEQAKLLKTVIKNHNAAMMRAVGDLGTIEPNKDLNEAIHKAFQTIHFSIEAWK